MGSATSQAPRLYDLRVSRAPLDPERISKCAAAVAQGIAQGLDEVGGPWIGSGDLTSLMSISAWMSRAGTDLGDSLEAMLALRSAVIRAAGFDRTSEPVPLVPADDRVAVVNVALYLEGLLWRACEAGGCNATVIASRALGLIEV
jgi:hypothetical protein